MQHLQADGHRRAASEEAGAVVTLAGWVHPRNPAPVIHRLLSADRKLMVTGQVDGSQKGLTRGVDCSETRERKDHDWHGSRCRQAPGPEPTRNVRLTPTPRKSRRCREATASVYPRSRLQIKVLPSSRRMRTALASTHA
jgi:hypothetical protein